MDRLRATSRKHVQQKLFLGFSIVVLASGLLPFAVLRGFVLCYLGVLGVLLVVGWMKGQKKLTTALLSFYWVYLVEVELLRSDFVWAEISSDLQKGRRMVELPAVRIERAEKFVRVVAVRNSLKFQERLLKADLSAVFDGWVTSDVNLNEDKSEVLFTFTKQGADLGFKFDSVSQLWSFGKAGKEKRVPLDMLTDMKLDAPLAVTGQSGQGKSYALVYLVLYYLSRGWWVAVADPKNADLAMLGRALGLKVATDADGILGLMNEAYDLMEERKLKLQGSMDFGKTALDLGEPGLLLIVDEFASLALKLDKKQSSEFYAKLGNLVLEGRQMSVFLALCMQQANAQVVPTHIREQLGNKLVMGASDDQTYVTLFGQSSASEVLSMAMKPGQAWLMTEGRAKPVFVRVPWLTKAFDADVTALVRRKLSEANRRPEVVLDAGAEDKPGEFMP